MGRFLRPKPDGASDNRAVGPMPPQGTRATVPMGHQYGPKIPPTGTQAGGTESVPNTQSTTSQVRGWPANPARDVRSAPGTREVVLRTDAELQTQPAPARIIRTLFVRIFGNIGESGYAFPYDAGFAFIPHHTVPRRAQGTSGPMYRLRDDNANIPAIYAGNPRLG